MNRHIEILGPVFLFWIAQLHDKLTFMAETRGRKALYCTRAGKRIDDLMRAYTGGDQPFDADLFGISRIGACKVAICHPDNFDLAFKVAADVIENATLADVCKAYLQHSWDDANPHMGSLSRLTQPFHNGSFRALLAANDPAARYFRGILEQSRDGLRQWLTDGLEGNAGYVLVDSGWRASIQMILREVYPEFGFEGLYFGVMDDAPMAGRFGIIFDSKVFNPAQPATVFALHRHLIESVLEPNAPSVEDIIGGPRDDLARAQIEAVRTEVPDPQADALFLGLRDYIARNAAKPLDEVLADYHAALPRVVDLLTHPTREDALVLGSKHRSVDFGRQGEVPVLIPQPRHPDEVPDQRINDALWPQGQIALEYDGDLARRLQDQISGLAGASYFASHEKAARSTASERAAQGKPDDWHGSVAIVTRTKNRPLLFRRAAASVAAQTYRNFRWVIVNDGGDPAPVEEIIASSGVDPWQITLINNPESVGMEAASNMGIRAVDTEYVVIHDDDDRWEAGFLAESVAFLESPRAAAAGFEGVLSRAMRVSEQIIGDRVVIHDSKPFMPWVSEVTITQMAVGNFFAPISFLYRRWVYDDIGGYHENLPVLGDWRFNLDFLIRANIGFLDKYLSHYHHRDKGDSSRDGVYANSVVGGQSLHAQYQSVVINGFLRDPNTPPALAMALTNGHVQRVSEMHFKAASQQMAKTQDMLANGFGTEIDKLARDPADAGKRGRKGVLPEGDARFIRKAVLSAMGRNSNPVKRVLLRWRWKQRLRDLEQPEVRQTWVPRLLHIIPSPPDFDHIEYLRLYPEIWATHYNGTEGFLPYHHYLEHGIDKGYRRPTLGEAG